MNRRNSRFIGLFGAFLSITAFVGFQACSFNKETPQSALSPKDQAKLDEMKAEVELGRNMAGRLLEYYGTYGEEQLIGYVNQVGNYVAGYGDYPERRYMFALLNNDSVNAFACPGGYVLVTLGTLRNAKTEAELAMVLGHEIAHVGKQHMYKTLKTMSDKEREKAAASVDKHSTNEDIPGLTRRRPAADANSDAGVLVARYLSGSAGAAFGLLEAAKAGMSLILEKGLDKDLEYEADQEGVKYAVRAGYDPQGLMTFLNRLRDTKKKKGVDMKILEKTHPKVEDRTSRIATLLVSLKANEMVGAQGKERFALHVANLPEKKAK